MMGMMNRARRVAGFAITGLLLGVLALSPAMPVSALDQAAHTIRVTENQKVEKEFGPIPGQNPLPGLPAPAPKLNTPETCRQQSFCDVIPLEIVLPPTLTPADEFFVTVALEWKTERIDGISAGGHDYIGPTELNDMDLYVWDDPVGEEGLPVQQSSTATNPEKVRIFRPSKGKYSIVVFNYIGPNTGYKLTVEYRPESIVPPFESLAPGFQPIESPPVPFEPPVEDLGPVELPVDTSGQDFTPVTQPPAPPAESAPAPLTPVVIEPDPDFTNFADDAFDEQLAAPTTDVLTEKQVKAVGPPKPASAESLIFWLAIVPLLLLAGGGMWLSKKGSAVLKLR
jgi:hypothetical protein